MSGTPSGPPGFAGYWADTPYVEFHHVDQEPWRMALEVRRVGGRHPDLTRPFVYCDIGCGRGYTVLGLAAALPHGEFHGVDLNPAHIAEARRLAAAAGLTNAHFHEGAAEALPPGAVPLCDFIAAYGVFSWVGPEIAARILAFIQGALKPDGILLASINLESGWAQMLPVRRQLRESYASATGTGTERLRAAIAATRAVFAPGSDFATRNPTAMEVMAGWPNQMLAYIPHELMNETWRLFSIREAFEMFAGAGFAYAGARLRNESDVRAAYGALIQGDDETAIEDRLSKARAERFRSLVFRPAAAATPAKSMIVAPDETLGAHAPRNARELYPDALIDSLGPAEIELVKRSVNGAGVSLAEITEIFGKEAKLKLFATINQLARAGDLATYREAPAAATDPARIAPVSPLTPALLATRYATAVGAHAPSPVFGGAVSIPGPIAALLRAHLDGAADLEKAAASLWRDAVSDPDLWAVEDPGAAREVPDFVDLSRRYRAIWLPFLERMRVIAPV